MTKALVIDDSQLLRRMTVRILASMGYEVIEARDGRDGLKMFRAHRPALVITDIFMPRQEGFKTIRELRTAAPDVAIIAMSGGGPERIMEFLQAAAQVGANATLAKPFRSAELIAAVRRLTSP